jgi:two-component system response regulator (stage 0 sporulation protein F)
MEEKERNRILIVDDQFGIRVLLTEIFQSEGFTTFQASNGVQALSAVEKEQPGLVLLDMKIPGMDGLEILKRMKERNEEVKVIIMTAYGELDMIQEALESGAITHLAKPFDIDKVVETVSKELLR